MNTQISTVFAEQKWITLIPNQYLIETIVISLSSDDVHFLLSDDTNPDLTQFSSSHQIQQAITTLGGSVFVKVANRSPKDCSRLDRKVCSAQSLVMLVKLSEYLTEALSEESNGSQMIVRKYCRLMEDGTDQFRVYVVDGHLVGICQKDPSFLGTQPTVNQMTAIKKCKNQVEKALFNHPESFVIDIYVSQNGKEVKVFSVQPFHIHALSLFEEDELRSHPISKEPLVKIVTKENELKDIDLSDYRTGSELKHLKNVNEWIEFMKQSEK